MPHGGGASKPGEETICEQRVRVPRGGNDVLLQSRDEKSLNRHFPEMLDPLREQLPKKCVLDGELVIVRDGIGS